MNTVVPTALPSLPLAKRKSLPDEPGIYFALSVSDEVLYVGRATSLLTRWQTHHRLRQLKALPDVRIAGMSVDDPSLLPEIERALITHFMPPMNRARVERREGEKVPVGLRIDRRLLEIITELARRDDRSVSNMVERLLRSHPAVKAAMIETEAAGAGA